MKKWVTKALDRPWIAIIITAILSVVIALFLPKLRFDADLANLIPDNDPVIEQLKNVTDDFGSQSLILIAIKTENIYQASTLEKIEQLSLEIKDLDGVEDVISPFNALIVEGSEWGMEVVRLSDYIPETTEEIQRYKKRLNESPYKDILISQDEKAAIIMIKPDGAIEPGTETVLAGHLSDLVASFRGPEEIYVVGDAYGAYYAEETMKRDILILTPLVFFVLLAVLFLGFRSVKGVLLPMVTVAISALWAVSLMALLGIKMSIVTVLVPVILLAVGSAQGIHIINRYFSYLNQTNDKKTALKNTMEDMLSPILMTSLTTVAGFVSLVSSPIPPVRYFGLITGFGVVVAMLLSLFFIPAVLNVLPQKENNKKSTSTNSTIIGRVGVKVAKNPTLTIFIYVLIALVGIWGSFKLKTEGNMLKYFEKNSPVILGTDIVEEQFGGSLQMTVVVDTKKSNGVKEPEVLEKLEKIESFLVTVPYVSHANSLATVVKEINKAFTDEYKIPDSSEAVAQELLLYSLQGGSDLEYLVSHDYDKAIVTARVANAGSEEIKSVINTVEEFLDREFANDQDVQVILTGMPKVIYRVMDQFAKSQITSLLTSSIAVSIIVTLLMKSFLYGLLSILPLIVTIAVNFGFMGVTNIPLDAVTSMISGIAIGIGVDYSIHYLSTFVSERRNGTDLKTAIYNTGVKSGSGIYLNALTLFLGFLTLVVSNFRAIKLFGFLTAMTMLLSAFSALTLLPAILVKRDKEKIE